MSELADRFRAAVDGKPVPEGTEELVRALSTDHPVLAGEALEVMGDLQPGKKGLELFQESVRLRWRRGVRASYAVASAALKAAQLARQQKQDQAFLDACAVAVTCEEHPFPHRMAREALAQHHCQRGEFAKALAALGPLTEVGSPFTQFPAGLLVANRRWREAAALWEDLPEPFLCRDVLCKVWALHRAGDKKEATRILWAARSRKGYFYAPEDQAEASALAALASGRSSTLPERWHPEYGPIAHPAEHETNLAVFSGVRPLRVTAVATQLHRWRMARTSHSPSSSSRRPGSARAPERLMSALRTSTVGARASRSSIGSTGRATRARCLSCARCSGRRLATNTGRRRTATSPCPRPPTEMRSRSPLASRSPWRRRTGARGWPWPQTGSSAVSPWGTRRGSSRTRWRCCTASEARTPRRSRRFARHSSCSIPSSPSMKGSSSSSSSSWPQRAGRQEVPTRRWRASSTTHALVTKDTPETREAFAPTADDAVPLKDGLIYFWWD